MAQHNSGLNRKEATELSRMFPELYEKLERDVSAMVQQEVQRVSANSEAEFRKAFQSAARNREDDRGRSWASFPGALDNPKVLVGIAAAIGVVFFLAEPVSQGAASVWNSLFGGSSSTPSSVNAPLTPADMGTRPAREERSDGEALYRLAVDRYNQLLSRADDLFNPLVVEIEGANPPEALRAALAAWRARDDAADTARVHTALVQAMLRQKTGVAFEIDGESDRQACNARTCLAVRQMWETDQTGGAGVLPAVQTSVTPEQLDRVEKALVYLWISREQ